MKLRLLEVSVQELVVSTPMPITDLHHYSETSGTVTKHDPTALDSCRRIWERGAASGAMEIEHKTGMYRQLLKRRLL